MLVMGRIRYLDYWVNIMLEGTSQIVDGVTIFIGNKNKLN